MKPVTSGGLVLALALAVTLNVLTPARAIAADEPSLTTLDRKLEDAERLFDAIHRSESVSGERKWQAHEAMERLRRARKHLRRVGRYYLERMAPLRGVVASHRRLENAYHGARHRKQRSMALEALREFRRAHRVKLRAAAGWRHWYGVAYQRVRHTVASYSRWMREILLTAEDGVDDSGSPGAGSNTPGRRTSDETRNRV